MTTADVGRAIRAVGVVVPVHDEQDLLRSCLESLAAAVEVARGRGLRVEVFVVLDACRDASASIAAQYEVSVVTVEARSVGVARAAGVDTAFARLGDIPAEDVWLAHTDADSTVPPNWVVHQTGLADYGADVVVGTVRPDFADLDPAQVRAWLATHSPGVANGHVHGANLGIRGSVYAAAGGFPAAPAHEDVQLVEAARAAGARVVASAGACVQTSGRQVGRAPDGYARHLREDLVPRAVTSM